MLLGKMGSEVVIFLRGHRVASKSMRKPQVGHHRSPDVVQSAMFGLEQWVSGHEKEQPP